MEELLEIRSCINEGRYSDALLLIDDLDEMAKDDKLHKIRGFSIILLIHLIKQEAEQRSTPSWNRSIKNAITEIKFVNKRRKSKGVYADTVELKETLEEAYESSLRYACEEAFGGLFDEAQLAEKVNKTQILAEALKLITDIN